MNIPILDLPQLKALCDQVAERIRELEAKAIDEIEAKAAIYGLTVMRNGEVKQKRHRRTKAEMAAATMKPES